MIIFIVAVIAFNYGRDYKHVISRSTDLKTFIFLSVVCMIVSPLISIYLDILSLVKSSQADFLFNLYSGKLDHITKEQLESTLERYKDCSNYKKFCLNLLIKRYNKVNNENHDKI
jgi:hypothetical protein